MQEGPLKRHGPARERLGSLPIRVNVLHGGAATGVEDEGMKTDVYGQFERCAEAIIFTW